MKSKERHDLRRNELLELMRNPRELAQRYGLPALIIIVAGVVAIYLIYRSSGAEERKWREGWTSLQSAVNKQDENQLRDIASVVKNEAILRAWANIKRGELLCSMSQQMDYSLQEAGRREDLLKQAISCYQQALQIGQEWREVLGQAHIGLGLCYSNLGQFDKALEEYEAIISDSEQRFEATIWLFRAQQRKAFLESLPQEELVFGP